MKNVDALSFVREMVFFLYTSVVTSAYVSLEVILPLMLLFQLERPIGEQKKYRWLLYSNRLITASKYSFLAPQKKSIIERIRKLHLSF